MPAAAKLFLPPVPFSATSQALLGPSSGAGFYPETMRRPALVLAASAAVLVIVAIAPAFVAFPIAAVAAMVWCFLLEREGL